MRPSTMHSSCQRVKRGGVAWPRAGQSEAIEIRDASFSGAWGISITWSDGHDTGIYAWANLRRWWTTGFDHPIEATD